MVDENKTSRDTQGRFVKGVSGNRAGRPKGSLNKFTTILNQKLEAHAEELVAALLKEALAGKPWALKFCMEKLSATGRVELELPEVKEPADVTEAAAEVIQSAAEGSVTIEEARGLLDLIDQQRKAIELVDQEVRLTALEEMERDRSEKERLEKARERWRN